MDNIQKWNSYLKQRKYVSHSCIQEDNTIDIDYGKIETTNADLA